MFYRIEFDEIIWPLKEKHGFSLEPSAVDLISKLLIKDKNQRLGKKGKGEILAHPFFKGLDLKALYNKQIKAPFKPPMEPFNKLE